MLKFLSTVVVNKSFGKLVLIFTSGMQFYRCKSAALWNGLYKSCITLQHSAVRAWWPVVWGSGHLEYVYCMPRSDIAHCLEISNSQWHASKGEV